MFTSIKNAKEKKTAMEIMKFVIAGSLGAAGGAYIPLAEAKKIVKSEPTFLVVNDAMKDPSGNVFVSASAAAATAFGATSVGAEAPAAGGASDASSTSEESAFAILDNVPLPASKRGFGAKGETYPFSKLAVGQSFFVPATAERPHPAKALASTVSSAMLRFATDSGQTRENKNGKTVPVYNFTKKFAVRAVKKGDVLGSFTAPSDGAIIKRTELST